MLSARMCSIALVCVLSGCVGSTGPEDEAWDARQDALCGEGEGRVFNTGGIGLRVRAEPNTSSDVVTALPEGTIVEIECQASGESVLGNPVWNYLPEHGGYVSDAFLWTGYDGFIPGMAECDPDGGGDDGVQDDIEPVDETVDGDGVLTETESNDSRSQADSLVGHSSAVGSISPKGDHDYYRLTIPEGADLTVTTRNPDDASEGCVGDTHIHVLDSLGTEIANDDDGADASLCSKVDPVKHPELKAMSAGTYYIWIQRHNDMAEIEQYRLDVDVQ